MKYLFLYVLSVVIANFGFDAIPPISLPGGEIWPPMSLFVGFIFVIRDYAQRETGHMVLPAMLVGGLISWLMASPAVALASVCAFLTSEFMDWVVYTFTGRPFSQRVLLSSCISTPIDSVVFLGMMGFFSVPSIIIMTLSKMVGAVIVYTLARKRELATATIASS